MTSSVKIQKASINFPSVTICNLNPVRYSQLENTPEDESNPRWHMWDIVNSLAASAQSKRKKVSYRVTYV